MVKKSICMAIIIALMFSVSGCGMKASNSSTETLAEKPTTIPVETSISQSSKQPTENKVAEYSSVPSLSRTQESTPASTADPMQKLTPEPSTEPTQKPTPENTVESTQEPTPNPTDEPIVALTTEPTLVPTQEPTHEPTLDPTQKPTPNPSSEPTLKPATVETTNGNEAIITTTQRNSINILNYITFLSQEINDAKDSRVFLETAYSALINNTYPNAVDARTQAQITSLLDTLEGYRMITVKRERIEFIYEQNRAQALRQAIPNPLALLSVV